MFILIHIYTVYIYIHMWFICGSSWFWIPLKRVDPWLGPSLLENFISVSGSRIVQVELQSLLFKLPSSLCWWDLALRKGNNMHFLSGIFGKMDWFVWETYRNSTDFSRQIGLKSDPTGFGSAQNHWNHYGISTWQNASSGQSLSGLESTHPHMHSNTRTHTQKQETKQTTRRYTVNSHNFTHKIQSKTSIFLLKWIYLYI